MAKSIKTLTRVFEWNVDQKRRELGLKVRLKDELDERSNRLTQELISEQAVSKKSPLEAGAFYSNYGLDVIRKKEILKDEMYKLDQEIEHLRQELNEAYNELKKFQVVEENREINEKKERERKEQIIMDDLGIEKFNRS